MNKPLLIGGYPKGYSIPFHPSTKSGKILRGILAKHDLEVELFDLWENEEQENAGIISDDAISKIHQAHFDGRPIVGLGKYVYECLKDQTFHAVQIQYLPHPASRRSRDIEVLDSGLSAFKQMK